MSFSSPTASSRSLRDKARSLYLQDRDPRAPHSEARTRARPVNDAPTGASVPGDRDAGELIESVDLERARRAVAAGAWRTPTVACDELGEHAGGLCALKLESLQ